ncbi:FtsH protease activity modulator HflK [Candidatus Entotheonella palauensis]|uniref:Protein HflK n=1 Tax=Candidatus Entotheonella gemina TaxID=1429439 RepID=W4MA46_9BACT|nr:FtsH protease activity modulator HflK [Candidatus Entotheonella palauensis]ETX07073.1 MAG: hypothetical protein ETSY2_13320 [Candidatus Entotheonella gemina]
MDTERPDVDDSREPAQTPVPTAHQGPSWRATLFRHWLARLAATLMRLTHLAGQAWLRLNLRYIGLSLVLGTVMLAVAAYLLSGFYTVQPGEIAVVRRFGKVIATLRQEGLRYRLPWPIETQTIVNASVIRRESIGLAGTGSDQSGTPLPKLQVLSGDVNLVAYEIIVQYRIREPAAYLFNINDAHGQLVRDTVQAVIVKLSGSAGVDAILTTERHALQQDMHREVQTLLDQYQSGLMVVSVNLQKAYPPDDVADAFRDVASAREDKDRAISEAEAYGNTIIPKARGEAERILAEATSYATEQVDRATGAAESFTVILNQYEADRVRYGEEVTRFRLYWERMEKILPRVQTYIINRGEQVNLRLLDDSNIASFPPLPGGSRR